MKKWKDKTRGGHPVEIWKEADGYIWGRYLQLYRPVAEWMLGKWNSNGTYSTGNETIDLMPAEPERIVIEDVTWPTFSQPIPTNFYFQTAALNGKRGRLIFEMEDEG